MIRGRCSHAHPVNGRLCEKPVGHWRFRDGRRYHRSNEPHTEPLRAVYPATWVHVWRDGVASRPVTDTPKGQGR